MRYGIWLSATVLTCAFAAHVVQASPEGDAKRLTDAATILGEIHKAPDRDIPQDLWEKAECVVVIPSVKKAAFILGGEYGKGVISCRNGGPWSAPGFMLLEKGSWGFQVGAESIDLVLLEIMNEQSVNRLLDSKITLGAETSVAAGPVGRDVRAMTDGQLKAQILSYSRAQGLFAGVDLTGGVLKPDNDENREYYGRAVSARELLRNHKMEPPATTTPFMAALQRTMPSQSSK